MPQSRLRCIALRLVKYSDTQGIATLWSRELGRVSALVPLSASASARRQRAMMTPLTVFEAIATTKAGQSIARLSDIRPVVASPASIGSGTQTIISAFVADFLQAALKDSAPDPLLFDFLQQQIALLSTLRGNALANFHISLMYRLTRFLGIEPDIGTYSPGRYFDMIEARFTATAPLHIRILIPEHAEVAHLISRISDRSLRLLRLSAENRNEIVDKMLGYYALHHAPLSLPSLEILRQISEK